MARNNGEFDEEWRRELQTMAGRIANNGELGCFVFAGAGRSGVHLH
jgi:hypothetical protein